MLSRRKFLQTSALIGAGSLWMPAFLNAQHGEGRQKSGRRLVVLQLSGGNDGLNTLVPFGDDRYYQARPQLAIPAAELLQLTDHLGFNPALKPLMPLYERGEMAIYNNVGYPNPDRSHFRSMDIWHTASDSHEYWSVGWLGRYLDAHCLNPSAHAAIELDDSLTLALKGERRSGFAVSEPSKLLRALQNPYVQSALRHAPVDAEAPAAYLYKILRDTSDSAGYLAEKNKLRPTTATYPKQPFGRDVQQIAQLILGGSEAGIYYASLSGFDTHAQQRSNQDRLLQLYAEAVGALVSDLREANEWDNTLILTFSEFGRRVAENASRGTDHGAANQVYLFGGALRQTGIRNEAPNLADLDDGDLRYSLDFRRIYASVLKNWLQTDADAVLGRRFEPLEL